MILLCWVFDPYYLETWPRSICLNSPMMLTNNENNDSFFKSDHDEYRTVFNMNDSPCQETCLYCSCRGKHVPYAIHLNDSNLKFRRGLINYYKLTIDCKLIDTQIKMSYSLDQITKDESGFQYVEMMLPNKIWFVNKWTLTD